MNFIFFNEMTFIHWTNTRQGFSGEIKTDLCTVNNMEPIPERKQWILTWYVPYITDIVWTRVYKTMSNFPLHLCLHNDRTGALYHWHSMNKSVQKHCQIALSIYIFTMIGQVPYITDTVWTRVYKNTVRLPSPSMSSQW